VNAVELGDVVRAAAARRGLARIGAVPVGPPERFDLYRQWLAAGHHGEMAYLASPAHLAARADLRVLLRGAATVVVAALAYDPGAPSPPPGGPRGTIARYARGADYHLVLRDSLVGLADDLARAIGRPVASRPCVDSAPVLERELAERAGLGFVGKNTLLIVPGVGSWVVLGELLLDVEVDLGPGEPARARCGACRACLDACPTAAFVAEHVLDARRCISYLTIEHRGATPLELRRAVGGWVFGCDVCQEVCPYNAAAPARVAPQLTARDVDHAAPPLVELATAPTNQLRRYVRQSALRRIDRAQLLRNVCVALGNLGAGPAVPALAARLADPSPLVRRHAAWAIGEIAARDRAVAIDADAALARAAAVEADPDVAAELAAARGRGAPAQEAPAAQGGADSSST
jgi:epoxyqueuosine reductase